MPDLSHAIAITITLVLIAKTSPSRPDDPDASDMLSALDDNLGVLHDAFYSTQY